MKEGRKKKAVKEKCVSGARRRENKDTLFPSSSEDEEENDFVGFSKEEVEKVKNACIMDFIYFG